jgi:plasmid stability protein
VIRLGEVADRLHRKLKVRAAQVGLSLEALLLREARKIAERPTSEQLRRRLGGKGCRVTVRSNAPFG